MPWGLAGNPGTNSVINPAGTDFLGTTDYQFLAIETNAPGIGNRPSIVIRPSDAPNMPRGFVGIGTSNPQTQLNVESDSEVNRPTVHTGGPRAGYSFSASPGFPPIRNDASGERWEWRPSLGDPAQPTLNPPRASLWSFSDKLIVTSHGQTLLPLTALSNVPGFPANSDFRVFYPEVSIGSLPGTSPPAPQSPPEPNELVLGGTRTSIRGFAGPPQDPTLGPGLGIHLGKHWIRTNGNESERWMAFVRMFRPDLNPAPRLLQAEVPWVGPGFHVGSDARTKTNVWQVEGALEKLQRIRGVAFEWAEAESPDALGGVPGQASIGVLAQEVEEVFPELVSIYEPEHEYKAVDYQGLTSVLIEAVKELKEQNEALRSRIEALEGAQN
jgi:hypothetical protein